MMGGASGHVMGAGVGFSLVFALASAFVFLLPLMVGVLTWCEFSRRWTWAASVTLQTKPSKK